MLLVVVLVLIYDGWRLSIVFVFVDLLLLLLIHYVISVRRNASSFLMMIIIDTSLTRATGSGFRLDAIAITIFGRGYRYLIHHKDQTRLFVVVVYDEICT